MREPGRLARFKGYDPDPKNSLALADDHPAVVEGRTLFPSTVVGTFQSRRFLISGKNSAKIGEQIEKGPWAGFPVFTLTLEERATCPRSCHMWQGCFGNAMQWARRNDAFDPDFIPALKAEVITLVREVCAPLPNKPAYQPPKGIVIRLHVLGEFFSQAYVQAWGDMLEKLPELHVFGYTARKLRDGDGIAEKIAALNIKHPDRWVIRWSADAPGAGRTIVVDEDPKLPDVVMCPASTHATECCSTCALCWSPAAWPKTVAFLRHGIKKTRVRESKPYNVRSVSPASTSLVHEAMMRLRDDRRLLRAAVVFIAAEAGLSVSAAHRATLSLIEQRILEVVRPGSRAVATWYRVHDEPQETFPPAPLLPAPARKAAAPVRAGRDPTVKPDAKPVRERKPDEPLMPRRAHAHHSGGWGRQMKGSADQFDIGTPDERIAALPDTERRRIEAEYGAVVKKEPTP